MNTSNKPSYVLKSPALIFLMVAFSVFASEALVMLLLRHLPPLSPLGLAAADAALLVILTSPMLYFFLFRPLVIHIRERKQIEDALHRNKEEQFKIMLRASLDGFLITDMGGRFLEVNDAYCQLLGYSQEELLNMSVADVEATETRELTALHIEKLIETGSGRFETLQRRKDGRLLDIDVSVNHSELHGGRFYCFLRDITGRKQAERELLEAKVAAEDALRKLEVSTQSQRVLSRAIEQSPVVNVITDVDGNIQYVNPKFCELTGYTAAEAIGQNPRILNSGVQSEEFYAELWETITAGNEWRGEMCNKKKNGEIFWEYASISPVRNEKGEITQFIASKENITERKRTEEALHASEASLRVTLDNLPYMVWLKDADGRYIAANQPFIEQAGGTDIRDVLGKTDLELWPAELAEKYRADDAEVMSSREKKLVEEITVNSSGEKFWVETFKAPILEEDGKLIGTTGFARDITERRRTEEMLRENESRLKELFENLSSGVAIYRAAADGNDFIITAFNGAAERIENMRREDLIGKNVTEVFPGIVEFGLLQVFRRVWQSGVAEHFPVSFYHDGRITGWRENYVYKLPNGEVVAIYDDVTKEKQAEERMHQLAHFDALTNLPNRTLFADRLHQAIASAKRGKAHIALLFIDLDKFKPVNDELGHDVGDLLLKEVAKRLQNCVREVDTASRIGGDEFVVLLSAIAAEQDALMVAEKILYALNQPFKLADHSISISASIGIAVYPEHGNNEKLLTKNADIAMYYAKGGGRNNALLYRPDMVAG